MFGFILFAVMFVAVDLGKAAAGCVLCAGAGFAVGRIKNSVKLAAIRAAVGEVGHYATAEAQNLVRDIKAHL